jgi:hypothetical protein
MRIVWLATAPLAVFMAGCLQIDTGDGDAGTASTGTTAATDSGTTTTTATTPAAATGSGCTSDLGGGTILCTGISLCAGLAVDHDAFPDCGFRINGTAIDLECDCDGQLCTLGVPATCAAAQQILSDETEIVACEAVNNGTCTTLGAADAGTSSSCDLECESQCGGAPSCIQLCGC